MKEPRRKRSVRTAPPASLPLDRSLFAPGDRVAVAVSGGADSTALLRALLARREELGIVLSVVHVEHGIRGDSAEQDAEFAASLADRLGLPCEVAAVDARRRAAEHHESIEEAARNLRYRVFGAILASGEADKIATAHTLDDQAETVLMKLLRGSWIEGLSGISPVLRMDPEGRPAPPLCESLGAGVCVRPLLGTTRQEIEDYLRNLDQPWREDETNRSLDYQRNRIRHELLPALRAYNPQISGVLARLAANARAEETHWREELARLLPRLLLPGTPARGGGRANRPGMTAIGVEISRLQALDDGLRRRVLRAAAGECGATLDFRATERLLGMIDPPQRTAMSSRAAKRMELGAGVRAVRSARELRFERFSGSETVTDSAGIAGPASSGELGASTSREYDLPVPGTVDASAFGSRFTARLENGVETDWPPACIRIRAWRPGDRVTLAHSRGPKKVKEILKRMGVRGPERQLWPVAVWRGRIVWMRGVQLAPGGNPSVGAGHGDSRSTRGIAIPEIAVQEQPLDPE